MRFTIWIIRFITASCAAVISSNALSTKYSLERRGFDEDRFTFDETTYKFEDTITFEEGFEPERQTWFKEGLEDAISLAKFATNMPVDHPAFTNYFFKPREHKTMAATFDKHYQKFQAMMAVIADPKNYKFTVGIDPKKRAWATTDSFPPGTAEEAPFYTYMKLGPAFFALKYDKVKGILSPDEECHDKTRLLSKITADPTRNDPITSYEGRGHIILHELTHLHVVGNLAKLPPTSIKDEKQRCGTNDWKATSGSNESSDARILKDELISDRNAEVMSRAGRIDPSKNAESYAAAATEYWFRKKYNFPNKKVIPDYRF